jgi:hypothetical protein
MRLPFKGKSRKILKFFIWGTGILFGFILIANIIGIIVDKATEPQLNQLREDAIQYFDDYRKQGGYLRPVYFDELEEGNAWDHYAKAIRMIEPITENEKEIINKFLREELIDTAQVALILFRYENALNEVKKGLKKKRCLSPYEYNIRDEFILTDDYMSLRSLIKLFVSKGKLSLLMDKQKQGVDSHLHAARLSQDVTACDRSIFGHIIGTSCIAIVQKEIKIDLQHFLFDKEGLKYISIFSKILSSTWPSLGDFLLNESWRYTLMGEEDLSSNKKLYLQAFLVRPILLPSYFSVNKAWLNAVKSNYEFSKKIRELENSNWRELNLSVEERYHYIGTHFILNPFILLLHPPDSFTKRWMENILKIRLVGAAALVQLYYLQNNRYPSVLNEVKSVEMEDLLIDPMTGTIWEYKIFADGDSCEIYNPYKGEAPCPEITTITLGPPK